MESGSRLLTILMDDQMAVSLAERGWEVHLPSRTAKLRYKDIAGLRAHVRASGASDGIVAVEDDVDEQAMIDAWGNEGLEDEPMEHEES